MGSFLIGTGVTLVTFYIALIYGSIAIGLIGFAELVLMLLACLYLLIYCRHITADIRIPLTVAEKGKKLRYSLPWIRPCCFRQQKCVTVCAVEIHLPGMPEISGGTVPD